MSTYLTCAESAKMLREALKRNFPGVKFSVRSKTYAGGASITVTWNDGPSSKMVDAVAQRFAGADFDGMTDCMSYHRDLLVAADGTIREVHFGSDFIFCRRETKPGLHEACVREHDKNFRYRDDVSRFQQENSRDFWIGRALDELSIPQAETVEETAARVVAHIFSPAVQS